MPSKGGYTPPPPGGDRFYNHPVVLRPQDVLLQQQHQRMMHMQMLQQQQHPHQMHPRLMLQRRAPLVPEFFPEAAEARRNDAEESSMVPVTFPVPPSVGRGPALNVTTLDRLMEAVTPFIQTQFLPGVNAKGRKAHEVDSIPFYNLDDLCDCFREWSYYGTGVPLLLNGKDPTDQYYVPFLSGIQLYIDPSSPSSRLGLRNGARATSILGSNIQRLNNLSLGDNSVPEVVGHSHGLPPPSFQYFESDRPFDRKPLTDMMANLVTQNPELANYRSCDLLPLSWMCVAWYPIYRIPIGSTLKDLDASFLTFHSLSTQPRCHIQSRYHAPNTRMIRGIPDPTARISLPVFALAAYKLRGSIVSPTGPHECEQEISLLQAADRWLTGLEVHLPDFQFFRNNRR